MFKQLMSDFAFRRAIDKTRKMSKINAMSNSAVIASLLETQAKNWFTGGRAQIVNNLLKECILRVKDQDGKLFQGDFDTISASCATAHAVIEKDVDESFTQLDVRNQMKILYNLELVPERFLTIDWDSDTEEIVA